MKWVFATLATVTLLGSSVVGCSVDEAPGGVHRARVTGGPTVVFDLGRKPLPELPLPNDVATYPDPTSRTGRRINASLVASTQIERTARGMFSKLEGWGTFAPISIPFDKPLDAEGVKKRHADDDFAFEDDAVYLVNLRTGVPVPLDLGGGNFPVTLRELSRYWPNDPAKGEPNILFETRDEDTNHNGILDPGEDTDFDGVLDRPNFPGFQRPANGVDGLYTFYESETNTLIARPVIPLDEMTEYAFVVTDRLQGTDGKAVQSPFEYIHHPAQRDAVERAAAAMNLKQEYYGFNGSPLDHVQFVFTFTTQPTVSDMFALRDGAYGNGKFGWIGQNYAPEVKLVRAVGTTTAADGGAFDAGAQSCKDQGSASPFVAKYTPEFKDQLKLLTDQVFGIRGPAGDRLIESFDNVAYIAVGTVKVPWLLGDIDDVSPDRVIEMNQDTGEIPHSDTEVPFFIVVPKATAEHKPPFPVTFYGHGYTGNMTEGLAFAGDIARHGVVTVGMNAPGHGLELGDSFSLVSSFLGGACLKPFAEAFAKTRVRDLNHDRVLHDESGRDYWTAYLFHTRDMVRQAALEEVMVVRALRAFDGRKYDWRAPAHEDPLDPKSPLVPLGAEQPMLAGDFDQDGVIDFGGPDGKYFAWGGSLGGILSSLAGAVDPHIVATAPMAGGGALTDVGIRSFQGGVVEAVDLRVMGPLLVSVPADTRIDCAKDASGNPKVDASGKCTTPADVQTRTACKSGQKSIRWVAVDLNDAKEFEIDCVDSAQLTKGMDVVVGNFANDEVRCAQVTDAKDDTAGAVDFRLGIPASVGDPIAIAVYPPGSVTHYGKDCRVRDGVAALKLIDKWNGLAGDLCDASGTSTDCIKYQDQRYKLGTQLVSLSDGFGLRRQTPDFRKFMQLAQIALDPADPVSFAPYYYLRPRHDENGAVVPPAGILTINTVGDMNVPVNTGISAARIHGAIPFLRSTNVAAKDYPDYVAPPELLALYGDKTPNKVLLDNHVIEGIRWLQRTPAPPTCAPNVSDFPGCTEAKSYSNPNVCKEALFDPENLSEGAMPAQPQHPATPLRLGRLARPTAGDASAVWAPRLLAAKDGWTPNGTLAAVLTAFIVPEGVHGFDPPDPCKAFDMGMYLTNMVGRFFGTGATDLRYLTSPKDHVCAAVTDWKSPSACDWK